MAWIESLELQTWFVNVLSGDPEIFLIIALIFIAGMAGFFRMNAVGLFFMMGIFLLMFSTFIASSYLLVLISILGALLIGYILSRMFT